MVSNGNKARLPPGKMDSWARNLSGAGDGRAKGDIGACIGRWAEGWRLMACRGSEGSEAAGKGGNEQGQGNTGHRWGSRECGGECSGQGTDGGGEELEGKGDGE